MINQFYGFLKALYSGLILRFKKVNRWVFTSVSIGITVVVLGFLLYRQRDIILHYHWEFKPLPLILAFLIFSVALFWMAIVWGWIINNIGIKLSYLKHIRYYVMSNLAKRIPGTIWYVASRFQLYLSEGLSAKITTVASGIEMILVMLAGILIVIIFSTQTLIEYHISPIILIVIFFLGLIIVHPKVIQWILLQRKVEGNTLSYFFVIKGILFYIFSWIMGGSVLFEIGNMIYPIPINELTYVITSWTLVGIISTILFFSPSNFGITEIGLSLLLSRIVPSSIAVLIAISSRILMTLFEIIWAGFFLWIKPAEKSPLTQKD
jgi:glycosyltransferase 2 family protein